MQAGTDNGKGKGFLGERGESGGQACLVALGVGGDGCYIYWLQGPVSHEYDLQLNKSMGLNVACK